MQVGGGAVAGVQSLPSTSTGSETPALPYLGIAIMAFGAVMLVRHRPRQPFTQ